MNKFMIFLFMITSTLSVSIYASEKTDNQRLDEITERGSHVMPFDLGKTTHIFSKTDAGGIQQVIVKDKHNTEQIRLIRTHLSEIAEEFKRGNFSDPEKIHGASMPGLAELKAAEPGQIDIVYKELPDGAEITYNTSIEELRHAIHRWFNAQLSDHARHAVPGHDIHQHMRH